MIQLDVTSRRELLALVVGLKVADREFAKAFRAEGRKTIEPEWKQALEQSNPNRLQRRVLVQTSRVSVTDRSIRLKSGATGRLSSGESVAEVARAVEFGQAQSFRTRYSRKNPGGSGKHTVTRRTAVPVGPRDKTGKVVYPALGRFVPRAGALAADLFARMVRNAVGGS